MWDKKNNIVPDLLVIEGPKAGGHLGFSNEQIDTFTRESYEEEIKGIQLAYEKKFGHFPASFVVHPAQGLIRHEF